MLSVDDQIFNNPALSKGNIIPEWLFGVNGETRGQVRILVSAGGKAGPVIVRLYADQDDDRGILFAAQLSDKAELDFRVMRLRWHPVIGNAFARSFELTATEKQLA